MGDADLTAASEHPKSIKPLLVFSSPSPQPAAANPPAGRGSPLLAKLASVLPQGYDFGVHHLSTPPTRAEPLCAPPPDRRPDKTFLEQHFLAVSIPVPLSADAHPSDHGLPTAAKTRSSSPGAGDDTKHPTAEDQSVLILALEVYVFTTAYLTTVFVSKADTTGYLHLLSLPPGTPSPVRQITSAFVGFLLQHRQRQGVPAVVNLFARAQSQYLFPLSVENKGKHVQDDRGLVRWWCRVLDPLLDHHRHADRSGGGVDRTEGYLMVPGLEDMQMRALLPRTAPTAGRWIIGHPLERTSHYAAELDQVPPRCLIPRYPDDPKSRFYDELDEEAATRKKDTGVWKSVKTLDQFWDMMAFRQECSSGRLTGFVWLVLHPKKEHHESRPQTSGRRPPRRTTAPVLATPSSSFSAGASSNSVPGPLHRVVDLSVPTPQPSPAKVKQLLVPGPPDLAPSDRSGHAASAGSAKTNRKKTKKRLTGPIKPRPPRMKMELRNYLASRPTVTAYYIWPPAGRGEKLVDEDDYKRIVELLLHLEFSSLDKAIDSTRRWTGEVASGSTGSKWGQKVTGSQPPPPPKTQGGQGKAQEAMNVPFRSEAGSAAPHGAGGPVHVLAAGLLRKKRKEATADDSREQDGSLKVNLLGAGLVRKKAKPT